MGGSTYTKVSKKKKKMQIMGEWTHLLKNHIQINVGEKINAENDNFPVIDENLLNSNIL